MLQLSGFLLVPSFPGTSPTSQEPASAAVSCAGSGRVGLCCSSGRAGAGQDLGTRGRRLHRQTELSVLTVTSQQDPPFFFFPFPFLCCLFCILPGVGGRSRFQTHGRSPFLQRCCCWPGPSVARSRRRSPARLLFTIACTNSRRRRCQCARFAPRDGHARGPSLWPVTGRRSYFQSALENKRTEASRQAQSEPWWRGLPRQRCPEAVPRRRREVSGLSLGPILDLGRQRLLAERRGREEGKLLPTR